MGSRFGQVEEKSQDLGLLMMAFGGRTCARGISLGVQRGNKSQGEFRRSVRARVERGYVSEGKSEQVSDAVLCLASTPH